LGTARRKSLTEVLLLYTRPCAHIDLRVQDLCQDLDVELARDRLDDVPMNLPASCWNLANPEDHLAPSPRDFSTNGRDGRSPPPGGTRGASPQRSKFLVKNVVQSSLHQQNDGDEGTPSYAPPLLPKKRAQLRITMMNAQGFKRGGPDADAYCVCEVPGRNPTREQTEPDRNTQTPSWNHTFTCEYTRGDSLRFTVYDAARRDITLGTVLLGHSRFNRDGFSGELALQEGIVGSTPKLRVKIEFLVEDELLGNLTLKGLAGGEPQTDWRTDRQVASTKKATQLEDVMQESFFGDFLTPSDTTTSPYREKSPKSLAGSSNKSPGTKSRLL